MANTRDIRRRIKSVKNTAQITKAMQMVAATKMRRAQGRAVAGRPYAALIGKVASRIRPEVVDAGHPLLEAKELAGAAPKKLILVVGTDRGLCGGLNTNLFREIHKADSATTRYVSIGRKAKNFIPRLKASGVPTGGKNLLADFELKDNFTLAQSKAVSQFLIDQFLAGEFDTVEIVYSRFVNALVQVPTHAPLVPVSHADLLKQAPEPVAAAADGVEAVYLAEPEAGELLSHFLPAVIHFQVYQAILDARASEHSARMVAMKNATENAKGLIKDLTLQYNKVRQASITTELLEITTAQMAIA
ncbi:F-type H+-transporting ATPase subunit gamma [Verrucomicrobium sp. GAS474]|uniref:ATP synthase F1 subunit gamma n=1 Tax=Verrucomicrobium sp. GAS474 TaxID=1882831 RepID=UPI00087A55C7|nr:ATP synthase F1 subunit gamma [Verrucomicrobium sp. GAS474]SDT87380.1 F-type H+-transporting ATPase subunit gamma [Verrucomicrobium sp. GAS474]